MDVSIEGVLASGVTENIADIEVDLAEYVGE